MQIDVREILGVPIRELRKMAKLRQADVAQSMTPPCSQGYIAQIERRPVRAMEIDTLARYVEALGGDLHIVASFPNGQSFVLSDADDS